MPDGEFIVDPSLAFTICQLSLRLGSLMPVVSCCRSEVAGPMDWLCDKADYQVQGLPDAANEENGKTINKQ